MTKPFSVNTSIFDQYAEDYDAVLAHGLSISGENKSYFARGRILWLSTCLRQLHEQPQLVMDFGCGTGTASGFLLDLLGAESFLGVDSSLKSLEVARQKYTFSLTKFLRFDDYQPNEEMDLVFCNGVFHHIPVTEQNAALDYIYRSLRPHGLFAIWENNPWNPGTRYIVNRIPFDREAVLLKPSETRCLLRAAGFEILRTDFLFIFPRVLSFCRVIEPLLCRLPFGAQYQVLARKPDPHSG